MDLEAKTPGHPQQLPQPLLNPVKLVVRSKKLGDASNCFTSSYWHAKFGGNRLISGDIRIDTSCFYWQESRYFGYSQTIFEVFCPTGTNTWTNLCQIWWGRPSSLTIS